MYERFTDRARKVMQLANQEAMRLNHEYIGTEHILLGLIQEGSGVAANVLKNLDIDLRKIRNEVEKLVQSSLDVEVCGKLPQTPRAKKVIEHAIEEAKKLNHNYVGTEHLLLGLLREEEGVAAQVLMNLGLRLEDVREEVLNLLGPVSEPEGEEAGVVGAVPVPRGKSKTPALDSFGQDLTELARRGKLDPVIGRDREIKQLLLIVAGRIRPRALLVGEAGVGKRAVLRGLAKRLGDGALGEFLPFERVVAVDLATLWFGIGRQERLGQVQFWERLKACLNEARRARVLLYLDSLSRLFAMQNRRLVGQLKGLLRQGSTPFITAVTPLDFQSLVKADADLDSLFEPVHVEPLSRAETVEVLLAERPKFEEHHGVRIADDALSTAAELAERNLDGFLPEKALHLLDRAAALLRLQANVPPPDLQELDGRIAQLGQEKENAVADQDFEKAAGLRDQADRLLKQKEQILAEWKARTRETAGTVDARTVAETLALMTHGTSGRGRVPGLPPQSWLGPDR